MRKIDMMVLTAVRNWTTMKNKNTEVSVCDNILRVWLHGNLIFKMWRTKDKILKWQASDCGWNTGVTRARLNACLEGADTMLDVKQCDLALCVFKCGRKIAERREFNQDILLPTVGAEVEKITRHSSGGDYSRFQVWRVVEGGKKYLYHEYGSEAAARSVADKIGKKG